MNFNYTNCEYNILHCIENGLRAKSLKPKVIGTYSFDVIITV